MSDDKTQAPQQVLINRNVAAAAASTAAANPNVPPETVRIRVEPCEGNEEGIVLINKDDFDPKLHELADKPVPDGEKLNFSTMANAKIVELLEKQEVDVTSAKLEGGKWDRGVLIELAKANYKAD